MDPVTESPKDKSRFGIVHLLAFVAICAIAMACAFPEHTMPGDPNPSLLWWKLAFGFSEAIIGALCMTGAAIVLWRWYSERKFPADPGCLLFVFVACGFLLSNVVDALFANLWEKVNRGVVEDEIELVKRLLYFRVLTVAIMIPIAFFGMVRDRWWWRTAFVLLGLRAVAIMSSFCVSLWNLSMNAPSAAIYQSVQIGIRYFTVLICLWLVASCIVDWWKKVPRSRIHFWGVACFLLPMILSPIMAMIAMRFMTINELYGLP